MTSIELKNNAQHLLEDVILKFWQTRMVDTKRGGFYGRIDGHNTLHPDAPKGAVLNARILWSFAAAARVLHHTSYRILAARAYDYLMQRFIDREQGGVYWSLNADGTPLDTHKQIYAQAFALYGLAEYNRLTGNQEALQAAIDLFYLIEKHGRDRVFGGYTEATTRDWQPLDDMRLSEKDENTVKSQNTNLHVLEAYTNLYRVWPTEKLHEALHALIDTFEQRIILPSGHLGLFFDMEWNPTNNHFSAGHDIECSWLLKEAADVLSRNCDPTVYRLAKAACEQLHSDGSLGELDWWTQAETVVGFVNQWQMTNDQLQMTHALRAFDYIQTRLVDREHGEWYWGILPDGTPNTSNDKAGFWECPYHNSRMCLELIERL